MGIIINKDGTSSGVLNGIEKQICDKLKLNEVLFDSELTIIKINYWERDLFLMDCNYLIYKSTKEDLKLISQYNVYNEEDEANFGILFKITESIDSMVLKNYKFKNHINSTILKFFEHDSRSYKY